MPRKRLPPAESVAPDIVSETPPEVRAEHELANRLDDALVKYAPALERVGRLQVHHVSGILHRIAVLRELETAREAKDYLGLPYRDENGELQHVANIYDYCAEFLGCAYNALAEDAENLKALDEAGFIAAREIGLVREQLRALRKLPDDDREVVKEALAARDKETVVDILERLAARHQNERAAAEKEAEKLRADLEAKERYIAKQNERNQELERQLDAKAAQDWDERTKELVDELTREITRVWVGTDELLDQLDQLRERTITEDYGPGGEAAMKSVAEVYCNGLDTLWRHIMAERNRAHALFYTWFGNQYFYHGDPEVMDPDAEDESGGSDIS